MKKGQVFEGRIEKVEFPNKGIVVTEEGASVIVKDGVPGQKVRAVVNKIRKGSAEGRILSVIEKSPQEIEAPCPHFGECGGCTYQNLPYEEQLKMKEGQIRQMMDRAVRGEYEWEGIKASPVKEAYRNKMEFTFGDAYKDGPLTLGMHRRGSFHDIVSVPDCRIVDGDYRKILTAVLDLAKESGLPYYHRMRHTGFYRHLLVRKAAKTGEILVGLVTTTEYELEKEIWVSGLLGLELEGSIVGILHTKNDSLADAVIDEETELLYGKGDFCEELLGLQFQITPFSFFQTNSLGAEVLVSPI